MKTNFHDEFVKKSRDYVVCFFACTYLDETCMNLRERVCLMCFLCIDKMR